jgi:alpha-amylase
MKSIGINLNLKFNLSYNVKSQHIILPFFFPVCLTIVNLHFNLFDMGVLMQAFYWNCPGITNNQYRWWNAIRQEIPNLRSAGITALWLPPVCKAKDVISMGYDPFDFYDLGEYTQKNHTRKETWFGSKTDLLELIQAAHDSGIQVLADLVMNQCSGGDLETNP